MKIMSDITKQVRIAAVVLCGAILAQAAAGAAAQGGTNFSKYEEPKHLTGTIYSADRKKALFKFSRRSIRAADKLEVFRDYAFPDGRAALKEKVIYRGDSLLEYAVDDLQSDASGSVRIVESSGAKKAISFQYAKDARSRSAPKTRTEPLRDPCLVTDMVAPFLMNHWSELLKGSELKCRLIVVERRETVGFTFVKDSEARRDGRNVVLVKMSPTSPIISALVDPLFFTIEKDGRRRILEYSGRTALKVKEGNKWKDLDGVTVFEW